MAATSDRIRVLYSFPHKLGADRICHTAWHQVNGLAGAGAEVLAFPGVLHKPVAASVEVHPTLAWGKLRVSYKLVGTMRALAVHDYLVARRVEKLAGKIDIVHAWPAAASETLKAASKHGIPTVLERPNAHTRYAFEAVGREFDRLGMILPPEDEYFFRPKLLKREEEEYRLADYILCPSDFVVKTFLDQGFPQGKLVRHRYGFDEMVYRPASVEHDRKGGLKMLFVGVCAVRKGVHFALKAWLQSPASQDGIFQIAGKFLPSYAEKLAPMLSHPSVRVLGYRNDVVELMRTSDILVLPSLEEGSALVTSEARGSGCVLLVSEAAGAVCTHLENGLVHQVGEVETLTQHMTMLHEDRALLERLRAASLKTVDEITWGAAGFRLLSAYREVIARHARRDRPSGPQEGA